MLSSSIFGMVLFYPIISIIISKLLGYRNRGIFAEIKNEYYLWIGFSVMYVGIVSMIFFGLRLIMPEIIAFITYTIGYFAISVLRKTAWTESKDIFKPQSSKT